MAEGFGWLGTDLDCSASPASSSLGRPPASDSASQSAAGLPGAANGVLAAEGAAELPEHRTMRDAGSAERGKTRTGDADVGVCVLPAPLGLAELLASGGYSGVAMVACIICAASMSTASPVPGVTEAEALEFRGPCGSGGPCSGRGVPGGLGGKLWAV